MPSLRLGRSGYWRILVCAVLLWAGAIPAPAATDEAYRLNQEAVRLTAQGQYEEAIKFFTDALRLQPRDSTIRRNLATAHTMQGHRLLQGRSFEAARNQYQEALDLFPDDATALLGLGNVQFYLRNIREAEETYRRVIGLQPRNPVAYVWLGAAYYALGDLQRAESEWQRALALRPNDGVLRELIEEVKREARVQSGHRERGSQHFRAIYEGKRQEDIGQQLLQILERAYTDVGYELGAYPPYEVQTIFYSEQSFLASEYGIFDGKIRVGLRDLTLDSPLLRSVLYHEYAHALIYAITRGNNPPRWVHEGLAVHMEKWRADAYKQEAIRRARAGSIPPLDTSPYMHGSAAIGYLIERYGMPMIQQMLRRMGEGIGFSQAFQETFQRDLGTFRQEFRDLLVRGY